MRIRHIIILLSLHQSVAAQIDREPPPVSSDMGNIRLKENKIYGKVVDQRTGKSLEAVSTQLFRPAKDSLIAGMLTRVNGDFSFERILLADSFRIIFSAIGYESLERIVRITGQGNNIEMDLGNIALIPEVKKLGEVTVTAQSPRLVMGIDRKIFNVEKSLVSTGGTGLDVLRNIPSVSVDVEGNITLP